ncbi:hypothetical protein, partial [Paracoccus sp. S4493]|uniref:hypothetical protein n=1 Tax=Paracoccus sp. S4493 TaxID=579490 RepID=UPI000A7E916D
GGGPPPGGGGKADAPEPAQEQENEFFTENLNATHNRAGFSCGVQQVDNFFHKTAGKLDRSDNIRVRVMVNRQGDLLGFYALNAHATDYKDLPKKFSRTAPSHGSIPTAFISMIGRDERYRGQSIGQDLLVDALYSIKRASKEMGLAIVMLDVLDCGDDVKVRNRIAIYTQFGFEPMESQPLRMFMQVRDIDSSIKNALGG